jgi:hypothetical protein
MKMLPLLAALLLLAACGSNREIQKDGSGSDEMLKSPCACAPVPYDTTFYRWDVG